MMTREQEQSLLEELSALEHQQWMSWAKHVLAHENISDETRTRWQKDFVPYQELSEEVKEKDREFARKTFEIFKKYL